MSDSTKTRTLRVLHPSAFEWPMERSMPLGAE